MSTVQKIFAQAAKKEAEKIEAKRREEERLERAWQDDLTAMKQQAAPLLEIAEGLGKMGVGEQGRRVCHFEAVDKTRKKFGVLIAYMLEDGIENSPSEVEVSVMRKLVSAERRRVSTQALSRECKAVFFEFSKDRDPIAWTTSFSSILGEAGRAVTGNQDFTRERLHADSSEPRGYNVTVAWPSNWTEELMTVWIQNVMGDHPDFKAAVETELRKLRDEVEEPTVVEDPPPAVVTTAVATEPVPAPRKDKRGWFGR